MPRPLRLLLVAAGGFAVAAAALVGTAYVQVETKRARTLSTDAPDLKLEYAMADIDRGRNIAVTRGCVDCHGDDLGGKTVIDDPAFGKISGPNLTRGQGGTTQSFRDEDWVRAIRYGVSPTGRPYLFMPSHEFNAINDADTASLVDYLKNAPPVDRATVPLAVGPVARVLHMVGQMPILFPSDLVDRTKTRDNAVVVGPTPEYGKYLAASCVGCHGADYRGGKIPGVPPDWPAAADLTASGDVPRWTRDDFFRFMREGVRPDGRKVDKTYMPWANIGQLPDPELEALYLYVQSLAH